MESMQIAFKDIVPELKVPEKWKEVNLNTGGTQSTLQDIKLPQKAGGYWYKDNKKNNYTRNRFISWQTTSNSIELSEWSLDTNLRGSHLRCKVATGTSPLNNVTFWEQQNEIVILIATISSVHRLIFPHPNSIYSQQFLHGVVRENSLSIFNDATTSSVNTPTNYYIFTQASTASSGNCSSMLRQCGEAVFALSSINNGSSDVTVVVLPKSSPAVTLTLRRDSGVPRLLAGISGAFRGKWSNNEESVCDVIVCGHSVWAISGDSCIRVWNVSGAANVTSLSPNAVSQPLTDRPQNHTQRHLIQQAIADDGSVILFIFFSFVNECEFVVVKPTEVNGSVKFTQTARIYGPELDLVDFVVTLNDREPVIWAIWAKPDGENIITRFMSGWWQRCEEPERECTLPELPANEYVDRLLAPATFSPAVIYKAIQVYLGAWCGSAGNILNSECSLREAAVRAVHARLQRAPHTPVHRCWSDLYSWCVQYMEGLRKPLGLIISRESCESLWVVRGGGTSLVCSSDPLHMSLLNTDHTPSNILLANIFPDPEVREDVWYLVQAAALVDSRAPKCDDPFTQPQESIEPDLMDRINTTLEPIKDLQKAMMTLNNVLRLDNEDVDDEMLEEDSILPQYQSDLGVSIITEALGQMADLRMRIVSGAVRACLWSAGWCPCAGPSSVHYRAYKALLWLRSAHLHPIRRGSSEELYKLKLCCIGLHSNPISNESGIVPAWWRHVAQHGNRSTLSSFVECLATQLWAVSGGFEFGSWLATIQQPQLVQTYVTLLEPWCEWNACSRQFIMGVALLDTGDIEGAYTAFCKAAKGVTTEPFLLQIIGDTPKSQQQALVLYYLKVIKLFEIHDQGTYVVRLAESAISIADKDDPNLSVFQWRVFRERVESGDVRGALCAAAAGPASALPDAAAELIRSLGSNGRLNELLQHRTRGALAYELERAASARARLQPPQNNQYYHYLFADRVMRGHYRKAGSVAYEQGALCGGEDAASLLSAALACVRLAATTPAASCYQSKATHAFLAAGSGADLSILTAQDLEQELKVAQAFPKDTACAASELCSSGLYREAFWMNPDAAITALAAHACKTTGEESTEAFDELRKRLIDATPEVLKNVTSVILSTGQHLPHWLFLQYLNTEAASLIRLLRSAGLLECACDAALRSLKSNNTLPLHCLDPLVYELAQHTNKPLYKQLYDELNSSISEYLSAVSRQSDDIKTTGIIPMKMAF